jgi:6-pyruvoyltetrahydropterin 2'-reductase
MIRLAQRPFLSVQGEGPRTGKLTVFIRFFGCNLKCPGFFQTDPTKPETYIKPILVDPKSFKTLEDFPVVEYGCDTLYAIDPAYKHLAITYENVSDLIKDIDDVLPKVDGIAQWHHPHTNNAYDICFTGGEPMLQQSKIKEILSYLDVNCIESKPTFVQFETNGTKEVSEELMQELMQWDVQFNISPKLFNVTGEKAWYPDIINNLYKDCSIFNFDIALKFVVNATSEAFDELDEKVKDLLRGVYVYIMPVGSSFEQQSDYKTINKIATMAVERGYHISGRLHCNLFGNSQDR